MKPLRVLALMHDTLVPPEEVTGYDVTEVEWKMEFDVCETLRTMGHTVVPLGVKDELSPVRKAIADHSPHIIFNLLESFHDVGAFDQHVASFLELLRVPYTGCNPRGLTLARDKAISKTLLARWKLQIAQYNVRTNRVFDAMSERVDA